MRMLSSTPRCVVGPGGAKESLLNTKRKAPRMSPPSIFRRTEMRSSIGLRVVPLWLILSALVFSAAYSSSWRRSIEEMRSPPCLLDFGRARRRMGQCRRLHHEGTFPFCITCSITPPRLSAAARRTPRGRNLTVCWFSNFSINSLFPFFGLSIAPGSNSFCCCAGSFWIKIAFVGFKLFVLAHLCLLGRPSRFLAKSRLQMAHSILPSSNL